MLDTLAELRKKVVIGFVGGSDLSKQMEQLGDDGMYKRKRYDFCRLQVSSDVPSIWSGNSFEQLWLLLCWERLDGLPFGRKNGLAGMYIGQLEEPPFGIICLFGQNDRASLSGSVMKNITSLSTLFCGILLIWIFQRSGEWEWWALALGFD